MEAAAPMHKHRVAKKAAPYFSYMCVLIVRDYNGSSPKIQNLEHVRFSLQFSFSPHLNNASF